MRLNLDRFLGLLALSTAFSFAHLAEGAAPVARKIFAVANVTQNFSTTRRSIDFYDITRLSGSNVLNQQPLFSAWVGWEDTIGANFEEISAITTNPVNGTVYMLSFDSGTAGVADAAGDTQGDFDLYRIDYQELLRDFTTNNRPRGTMYAPTTTPDGFANQNHPDNPTNTVRISNAISKVGEVARSGPIGAPGGTDVPFFDPDLEFRDPTNLVLLDNQRGPDAAGDTPDNDHRIRILSRVNQTPGGNPGFDSVEQEGGFNRQTQETWRSDIAGLVNMDFDGSGSPIGRSEPESMTYVRRDGIEGIWIGESDGGNAGATPAADDVSFFQLDFAAKTAVKKELRVGAGPNYPDGFALDNNPVVNPSSNNGSHDWVNVDKNGNLLIGESGFFDAPQTEPKVITRTITNYDGADTNANTEREVVPGTWLVSSNLPQPTSDDDTFVTDGRFVVYDAAENRILYVDIDSGSAPNVVADLYAFDLDTNTFEYQEQNAVNAFVITGGLDLFVRGDISGDGRVNATDIDRLFRAVSDPTLSGFVSAAVGREWYDLTGDANLNGTPNGGLSSDADELVRRILGTEYGDANLDGTVSLADLSALQLNFGSTTAGWAGGNFNGDGSVSLADLSLLQLYFGFSNMSSLTAVEEPQALPAFAGGSLVTTAAVPEASTMLMVGLGLVVAGGWSIRRRS
jgi:hypothetical protein